MDPASAVVTFVSTGLIIIKLSRDTLGDIEGALEEILILKDRAADVELLLKDLEYRQLHGLFHSRHDMDRLEWLFCRNTK